MAFAQNSKPQTRSRRVSQAPGEGQVAYVPKTAVYTGQIIRCYERDGYADQYYIKTGENFTDYSYKHGGWIVQFKLRNADVEQNNVKGEKRFFMPRAADVVVDETAHTLTIPFEFRPLNKDEEIRYGSKKKGENGSGNGEAKPADDAGGKKKKGQEGIITDAIAAIQSAVKKNADTLAALLHEKRKDADGNASDSMFKVLAGTSTSHDASSTI